VEVEVQVVVVNCWILIDLGWEEQVLLAFWVKHLGLHNLLTIVEEVEVEVEVEHQRQKK
jgi:hypothetical protein